MKDPLLLTVINSIPSLRWNEKLKSLDFIGDLEDFRRLQPVDLAVFLGRRLRDLSWRPEDLILEAERTVKTAAEKNIRLLTLPEKEYPPQLREIYDPPFLLFCRGTIPSWDKPLLGIVGTRNPSGRGRKSAFGIAFEAAGEGVTVVSGLARGIDGEAHRGCVEGGGSTVAVLGNGADTVYPRSHRTLGSRILSRGGLLLSEYGPGAGVQRFHFPARNRIISGLCRGILVAEAPARSGALITADYALEQGRDLYVHGDCLEGTSGEGTRKLMEDGAAVVRSMKDILRDWFSGEGASAKKTGDRTGSNLGPALPRGAAEPGKTLALFLEAELAGTMVRHQGSYFRRLENG
jgi:DNA processing protein